MSKRKRKAGPDRSEPTAAQIARMSGLSISRVYRLMQEGRTGAEIIATSKRRKEEFALRGLPLVLVNGHAADGTPSFSASQAAEKNFAAKLKELELLERRGQLIPVSYVKFWGMGFLVGIRDEMMRITELRDTLAAESDPAIIQRHLDGWLDRAMDKVHKLESLWAPPPSPEVM